MTPNIFCCFLNGILQFLNWTFIWNLILCQIIEFCSYLNESYHQKRCELLLNQCDFPKLQFPQECYFLGSWFSWKIKDHYSNSNKMIVNEKYPVDLTLLDDLLVPKRWLSCEMTERKKCLQSFCASLKLRVGYTLVKL